MSNIERPPDCRMRTALGNCSPIGGFCTSNSKEWCEAMQRAYWAGYNDFKLELQSMNWVGHNDFMSEQQSKKGDTE